MVVYVVTNKINGKKYVGQTVQTLKGRWSYHKSPASRCLGLKSAIEKYGVDNFVIKEVAKASSQEEMDALEKEWIVKENSMSPNGYNLISGGGAGKVYSKESRKKMSESRKKYKQSPESNAKGAKTRSGTGNCNYGRDFSPEHRARISTKSKGNNSRAKIKVICIETGEIFPSISHAAKAIDANVGYMHQHVNGKYSKIKGLTFRKA